MLQSLHVNSSWDKSLTTRSAVSQYYPSAVCSRAESYIESTAAAKGVLARYRDSLILDRLPNSWDL